MVLFCGVILVDFVKGFWLKARILVRFNFCFPYRLPFKFVTTTWALFGSTQLMLFQLCIYEIRAPNTTQLAHLIHAYSYCYLSWSNFTRPSTLWNTPQPCISLDWDQNKDFPEKSTQEIWWHVTILAFPGLWTSIKKKMVDQAMIQFRK